MNLKCYGGMTNSTDSNQTAPLEFRYLSYLGLYFNVRISKDTLSIPPDKVLFFQLKLLIFFLTLRKHAYSNILKILQPKQGKFSDKNSNIFHISAQNIDCEVVLRSTHNLCF